MRSLHAVLVAARLPYPADSGNAIRSLELARRLARRHRITYVARTSGDADRDRTACQHLRDHHGLTPILVDDPIATQAGPAFAARLAINLFQTRPYSVVSVATPRFCNALNALARSQPVNLFQAEGSPLWPTLEPVGNHPRILIAHNVESLIWRRYRETEPHPLRRAYIARQCRKYERFEARVFRTADRVISVSSCDAQLIRRQFADREIDVVDNGVDRTVYESVVRRPESDRLLFLGSFDWRPNQDAVRLLLDQILPAVRRELPKVRLDLVGRRPPGWLRDRIPTEPLVELHADVPDVRPFLARAALMVVPLRIGGGSRLKILESLASGLPVVSTSVGAEGLELVPDRDVFLAETPAAFADRILSCLKRPEALAAQAAATRLRILDRYDWDHLADRLETIWYEAVDQTRPGSALPHNQPSRLGTTS
ncbi:MAG: glycosyl transferase family 1 [Isosphaeraceae bacterium]|jgi:glycosyltransferase involved in cell wall biosynthesis|nr:MAG: glycosyl transferase family 1 [Isosphaeraceae bacterium]